MKSFKRGLLLLLATMAALAVLAWRLGWWTPQQLIRPNTPPSAAPVIVASTPTPSPLPVRDRSVFRIAVDDRAAGLVYSALPDFIQTHGNDLKVQCILISDARVRWQMLAAGRVDAAIGTLDSFVLGAIRHNAGNMVFSICNSSGADALMVPTSITTLPELSGKRVSVVAGTGGAYLLGYVLDRVGISPSQVKVVETEDVRDAAQLLESGRVQGAWMWPPASTHLTGSFHKLTSAPVDILPEICAVNRTTMEQRRTEVLIFMRHWFELEALVQNNPGLGREVLARNTHHSLGEIDPLLTETKWTSLAENQRLDNEEIASQMRRILEFFRITGAPNSVATFDFSRCVKIDMTREVEVNQSTSVFGNGASPAPSVAPSSRLHTVPDGSNIDASPSPEGSTNDASPTPEESPEESGS